MSSVNLTLKLGDFGICDVLEKIIRNNCSKIGFYGMSIVKIVIIIK